MEFNRNKLSREQKFNILSDHLEIGTPISKLARLYGINPTTVYQLRKKMSDRAKKDLDIKNFLKNLTILKRNTQLTMDIQ